MGDTRRIGTRIAAMLVVVAGGLAWPGVASPAHAAGPFPDQCVEERSGQSVQFDHYSGVQVADLDVSVWLGYQELNSDLYLVNGDINFGEGQRWLLADQFSRFDRNGGWVTFDNQAPDDPLGGSRADRVRPRQPLPESWTSNRYTFYVEQGFRGPSESITVTITWSDCDVDRDFTGDKSRDNCVGLYNPGQDDLDGDRVGDPCDADDDNDGSTDAADNCPTVANAAQTDWDGDRIGNACDSTPGTAPVAATTPPAPTPTTSPTPGAASGCTTGCAYARTVGLRHRAARHRFVGTVESPAAGCRVGIEVTVWRKRSGADRKLVVLTTRSTGKFRTKAPRRPGRYYASVSSDAQPLCSTSTSPVVRVR